MKFLKKFDSISDYEDFTSESEYVEPNVSLVNEDSSVHYNVVIPEPTFDGKWLATYADSHKESGDCQNPWIDDNEINTTNLVSLEFGECTRYSSQMFTGITSLRSVKMKSNITSFYDCTNLSDVEIYGTTDIYFGEGDFMNCTSLSAFTCPNAKIVSVSTDAFKNCSSITSFDFTNMEYIDGGRSFEGCIGFTSVDMPKLKRIDSESFKGCTALTSVTIGNVLENMGIDVFSGCSNLHSITIHTTTPPEIDYDTFNGTPNDFVIYVPAESVDAYKAARNWSSYADRIQAIP